MEAEFAAIGHMASRFIAIATGVIPAAAWKSLSATLTPCNCRRKGRRSMRVRIGAVRPTGQPGQLALAAAVRRVHSSTFVIDRAPRRHIVGQAFLHGMLYSRVKGASSCPPRAGESLRRKLTSHDAMRMQLSSSHGSCMRVAVIHAVGMPLDTPRCQPTGTCLRVLPSDSSSCLSPSSVVVHCRARWVTQAA